MILVVQAAVLWQPTLVFAASAVLVLPALSMAVELVLDAFAALLVLDSSEKICPALG